MFKLHAKRRLVLADKWSQEITEDVKPSHEPKEGTFKGSAESIAKEMKRKHGSDFGAAMQALTFYYNRAGKNLSKEDKAKGERAKAALRRLYGKEEE
jgi:hypothetical protein